MNAKIVVLSILVVGFEVVFIGRAQPAVQAALSFGRAASGKGIRPWLPDAPGLSGVMEFVTVFRAFNPADAQLVRSRLEAAGFHAAVMLELSSLSMDGYAMAAGGILVQVPHSEADDAKEFLDAPTSSDESPPA